MPQLPDDGPQQPMHPRELELVELESRREDNEAFQSAAMGAGSFGAAAQFGRLLLTIDRRIADLRTAQHQPEVLSVEQERDRVREDQSAPEYPDELLEHAMDVYAARHGARLVLVRDGERMARADGGWRAS